MRLSRGPLDLSKGQVYPLDGSEVPLIDVPAAVALLPEYAQGDDQGAMRDIVLATVAALANLLWAAIAQNQNGAVSPRYADSGMLSVWGDWRQMRRYVGEATAAYRTRLLQAPAGVTPDAIKNAVRAAAAPFGATVAFNEPADDCSWLGPDDIEASAWCSFYGPDVGIYWNYDPTIPNQASGALYAPDVYGARFWVLMQLSAGSDATVPHFLDDGADGFADPYDFLAGDNDDYGFLSFDGDPLEDQVVAIVNAMKAFGVAWALYELPDLNVAI